MHSLFIILLLNGWFLWPHVNGVEKSSCYDYQACKDDTISGTEVNCDGELSCDNTLLLNGCCGSNRARTCMADHSCSNSIWYNASWFGAYGTLSLYNTTIYNSDITMRAWILGYFAAYDVTIYCSNNSNCDIHCPGNSCVGINFICDETSSCTLSGTKGYVTDIENSPQYYRGGLAMIPSIGESSIVTDAYNGGKYCSITDGSTCDYTTITIDQSYFNVYCRASRACSASDIYINNNNNNNNLNNSGIYCSGFYSCEATIMTVININNNNNNTVYCGGEGSCSDSIIAGFNDIYGTGYQALQYSVIISNGNNNNNIMNVYFGTGNAGDDTIIYCNFSDICNIYCDAYHSCANTIAHCYGQCNIYCDELINQACLTVYDDYTRAPTNEPSNPTMNPTMNPGTTIIPATAIPTVIMMTTLTPWSSSNASDPNTNTIGKNIENNYNNDIWVLNSNTWEMGSYVCLIFSLTAPIMTNIVAYIYHKQSRFRYCDNPNYFALFAAFWNFGDFYSDLLFAFVLITINNHLWYYAAFFSFVPHFVSNFVSLWNIRKWHNYNIYISKYLANFDCLIIVISVFAGFYTSIEVARSKLFYMDAFSMQLKNEDYQQLQKSRFYNTVLFENVPQFIIQIIYTYETGSMDIFVLSAMLFSVLSALLSISQQIFNKRENSMYTLKDSTVHYHAIKEFRIKIESVKFEKYHKYIHKIITKSLCATLKIDNLGNIEVFYVINIRNGIIAQMKVLNMEMNDNNKSNLFGSLLDLNNDIRKSRMFKQEIVERLHFASRIHHGSEQNNFKKIISDMKIYIEENKTGLAVRLNIKQQNDNNKNVNNVNNNNNHKPIASRSASIDLNNQQIEMNEGFVQGTQGEMQTDITLM